MVVKHVNLGDEGRKKLIKGIKTIAGAVKSTLGARGRTVLIESENHVGGITVTKDGVTVAKSINLYDPVENLAVMMMRQAAEKTATVAGDGTTTSIVIAEAIVDAASDVITSETNVTEVIREINDITTAVVAHLSKRSKKLSGKKLKDVASISANNDTAIGGMIAEAFSEVKMVSVENSKDHNTYVEVIKGIKADRGWTSRYFITDYKRQEAVLENPYILITDQEINNLLNIEKVLQHVVAQNKSLLIIGEMTPAALNTLNINVAQGKIKACNILPPSFGYRQKDLLEDLAIALDGTYFSEDTGDDLSLVDVAHLGRCSKVIVGKDNTIFMPYASMQEAIDNRIADINETIFDGITKEEMDNRKERVANLSGGVAVIYVGALSDIEQKEKRDRIDDAVCAVEAALEEGILPGGGVALYEYANMQLRGKLGAAKEIMYSALKAPMRQILENAGKDAQDIMDNILPFENEGYDVKGEQYGDMMKLGIIDPAKVTKNALLNAVSVATTIMSTNAIITNIRADESVK
jgi:chaperonin GroEL